GSCGSGWVDAGPNRTGSLDDLTVWNTFTISESTGKSRPSAKAPGNSGRTCSIGTRHDEVSGSQGQINHARSQLNTERTVSSTSLIIRSTSFVPWIARLI